MSYFPYNNYNNETTECTEKIHKQEFDIHAFLCGSLLI